MRYEQDESAAPIAEAQNVSVNEGDSTELRDQEYSHSTDIGSNLSEEEIPIDDNFSPQSQTYSFTSTTPFIGAVPRNPCMVTMTGGKRVTAGSARDSFRPIEYFSQFPLSHLSRMDEWANAKMHKSNQR